MKSENQWTGQRELVDYAKQETLNRQRQPMAVQQQQALQGDEGDWKKRMKFQPLDKETESVILNAIMNKKLGQLEHDESDDEREATLKSRKERELRKRNKKSSKIESVARKPRETFYLGPEKESVKNTDDKSKGFLDLFGVLKRSDTTLTREMLLMSGLTLKDLIVRCKVSIKALLFAGMVTNFEDLQTLRFSPKDIIRNRELFDAQTLAMFFRTTYDDLRNTEEGFNIIHLTQCEFMTADLKALDFTFDHMIDNNGIDKYQLGELNFTLSDLTNFLGFRSDHLTKLSIKRRDIGKILHWELEQYEDLCS